MKNHCLIFSAVALALLFFNCQNESGQPPQGFFAQNSGYISHLPVNHPDSCVLKIKNEVPQKSQLVACQILYYSLPENSPVALEQLCLFEKTFPSDSMRAFTQQIRGGLFTEQARFDTAITCMNESFVIYQKLKKPKNMGDVKRCLSRISLNQGDFPETTRLLLEALELYGKIDSNFEHDRYFNLRLDLANAYFAEKNYLEALKWSQSAWNFAHLSPQMEGFKIVAAGNLAQNYIYLNRPDSALILAKLALELHFRFQNYHEIDKRHFILAEAFLAAGNYKNALPHFQQATCCIAPEANRMKIFKYDAATADCYLCLGRLDSAEFFYKKCLASPDTAALAEVHAGLSKIFRKRNELSRALFHADESRRLHDAVFNVEKIRIVMSLNLKFIKAKQEKELAEIKFERQTARQQNWIIFLLFAVSLAALLFFVNRYSNLRKMEEQKNLLWEKEKQLAIAREALQKKALERSKANLEAKSHELEQTAQLLALKNQLIEDLKMQVFEVPSNESSSFSNEKTTYKKSFHQLKILTDDDWANFRERFEDYFPGFIDRLKTQFSGFTPAEIRLFLLIKLGFETREIAAVLGISSESIWKARYRLRKKIDLTEIGDLEGFVQGVG